LSPSDPTQRLQGLAAAQFKDHFSQLAACYAQFRPVYPLTLFEYLSSLCPRSELAWDCACGNGQATLGLAQCFESVVASDASAEQIASARAHPTVRYRVAPAEASGLEPASVDLVTVAQALHWLELDPFFLEVRRVLRRGGVLAVWSYGRVQVQGPVDTPLQQFYSETIGPYWPAERSHVEDGYRSLAFPFDEVAAPPFHMESSWTLAHLLGYVRSWSATARYVQVHGHDPVVPLEERLTPLWGGPLRERRISWPLSLRVGRHGP
jgi:SAM-dependent methyltransferase